ncbi:MAG: hypothetical protein HYW24_03705 [Candidatus Aenigmarchaeota archaeon]|nr:hypothetical protein [Candidatus Aenigmarchaeota archaeon]
MAVKSKFDTWLVVKATTKWMAILYIICATVFLLIPSETLDLLWKPMFHVFGLQPTVPYLILGFIEVVVYTALAVWLFVAIYNYLVSKR